MAEKKNLVSIGMPVYNGEKFIRQALDSLLAQDYGHFELIISDNASTDATPEICREYLALDRRIQFHRNEENRGARYNFRNVLRLASGKYFLWAADHDLWHPSHMTRCVQVLEDDADVVLCYPRALRIDAQGHPLGLATNRIDTRGLPPTARFLRIIRDLSGGDPIYGVMRTEAMQKVAITTLWAGDQARLVELSLAGSFAHIPEPLFYWRQIRNESLEFRKKTVPLIIDPVAGRRLIDKELPELWREFGEECLAIIERSSLCISDKENLQAETKRCFTARYQVDWSRERETAAEPATGARKPANDLLTTSAAPSQTPFATPEKQPPQGRGDAPCQKSEAPAQPLVSVIVPTYNRPDMLVATLQSILNQTYGNHEIIVVNDCGMDVGDMVGWLTPQQNITYVRHDRNRGLASARNTGLKLAQGKYIAYLDDDDLFYPDHLETLVNFLETTEYRVAYTDAHRAHQVKKHGRYVTTHRDLPYSHDFDADRLIVANQFPVLCLMHEKSCLKKAGFFDESLTTHEDWDLWIRLSLHYKFAHLKKVTCEFTWRQDGSTMTSQRAADFIRTLEIIHAKYQEHLEDRPHVKAMQQEFLEFQRESIKNLTPEPEGGAMRPGDQVGMATAAV